jgi:hypothetical protein
VDEEVHDEEDRTDDGVGGIAEKDNVTLTNIEHEARRIAKSFIMPEKYSFCLGLKGRQASCS